MISLLQLTCSCLAALSSLEVTATPSVWMTDDHGDAIYGWSEGWKSGELKTPATVVHFDTHSDMKPPTKVMHVNQTSHRLAEQVDINEFIVAAIALGKVNKVIWVKPFWATESPTGLYNFTCGEDDGEYVTDADFYPGHFDPEALQKLDDSRKVYYQMQVVEFSLKALSELKLVPTGFILDIDLDVFSSGNPESQRLQNEYNVQPATILDVLKTRCRGSARTGSKKQHGRVDTAIDHLQAKTRGKFLRDFCRVPIHLSTDADIQNYRDILFSWLGDLQNSRTIPGVVTVAESQELYLPEERLLELHDLPFRIAETFGLGEPIRFNSKHELHFVNDMQDRVEFIVHDGLNPIARFISFIEKDDLVNFDEADLITSKIAVTGTFFFRIRHSSGPSWLRRAFATAGYERSMRLSSLPALSPGDIAPEGDDLIMVPLKSEL